mgnify:CR=1 FL=1
MITPRASRTRLFLGLWAPFYPKNDQDAAKYMNTSYDKKMYNMKTVKWISLNKTLITNKL